MKENKKDEENINNDTKIENEQKEAKKDIEQEKDINTKKEENSVDNNNINNELKKEEKKVETKKILSSIVTTGKEKINDIYLKKVKDLSNIYYYTSNYILFLFQLFKKISEPFYSKLSSSYINNVKPYLKYFKDLVPILNSFSEKMNSLNSSINPELFIKEEESILRQENNLNLSVKKINSSIGQIYSNIAKSMKEIISQQIFTKYDIIETKFEENFHKMLELISGMEQFRIKYNNEFSKKYDNVFNTYVQKYTEVNDFLINMKDFFSIEYDIINSANFAIKNSLEFINSIKILYEESITIFCDYLEILKKMIKIFYQENKKIILINILPEKMVTDLEKLLTQDIRKNIEKKFSIKNIIEHYHDEALRNEINHLLLKYQDILAQFKILKNEEINDIAKFNLNYYKTTNIFFIFLKSLLPPPFQYNYEEGIQFKSKVKRDCGLFKGWKECHLVISYQGHILFFDEVEKNNNKNNSIETPPKSQSVVYADINMRKNTDLNLNMDDLNKTVKNNTLTNKEDAKYGIIPENLSLMYLKNSYGIRKKNKKQGKFLFEIWEKGLGNKKNRINIIDALNAKNLENILFELTETNIYDD